jgi:pyruvate/2-oxoglutarate/acetoin dehydrogenase E1 component
MKNRNITYAEAINESISQAMSKDKNINIIGQLVDYSPGVFGTTSNLINKFGKERVRDFPVAESLMTSMSLGMTIEKKRIILVHHRLDFMLYSMDAITNWISLWRFKSGTQTKVPIVIRAVVGKGWGQGPQHSKSLHSWFANLPGVRVALPTNAYDAKGLLLESIFSDVPTIIIEHRSLFDNKEDVPKNLYAIKFGKANVVKQGKDITIVCIGYMIIECLKAAKKLEKSGIHAEVIDIRTLNPLDIKTLTKSVNKTGSFLVVDSSWLDFGASAEILSVITSKSWNKLVNKPERIAFPNSHTPMSSELEKSFYPDENVIIKKIKKILKIK